MPLPRRAATLSAAGLIACVLVACRPAPGGPAVTREALRDAVATGLPFDARLSGGFAPSSRTASRAGGESREELSPDTRIAIALLEKRAGETPTPQALADLGVAYLVQGDVDRAIATINDAASQGPAAAPWSDLSAAYLVKAERTPPRRIEFLARALEAAERSLRVSPSTEALFNRALARDRLAPYTGTAAPWTDYLAAERDPQWRDAATREAGNDRPVADARDLWEARRRELRQRLAQKDAAFVSETVRLHAEAALEFFEQDALVEWSRAVAAGQAERMQAARAQARLLADAIHEVTRDPMPRDEVAALGGGGAGLARAHEAYAQGLAQYDANDLVNARRSFAQALDGFARANAPYRAWASAQLASIEFQERDLASAARRLAAVEREARARGYVTVLGRTLWLRGLVSSREWRLTESLSAFREAAATFETAAEREYAVSLYHHLADTLRTLGEQHESWEYIGRTLDGLPRVRKPLRRYLFLYNAALFASSQDLLEAALIFQDATVREAAKAGSDVLVEATIQRALVHIRRGDQAGGRVDLDAVAARLAAMPAGAFKSYVGAELEIARAQMSGADEQATDGLRHAISFFDRAEPARVPGLYLLLARTPQARASTATAEVALRAGIARLEGQQAGLGDEALKISYFDESWALFQDMVTLQAGAGNEPAAFEFAERSRARSLLAAAQGSVHSRTRLLAEIQAMLPPSVVIVHYSTLADRVLIWTITATAATLVERRVDEPALGRLVEQHRAAILNRRENAIVNDRLHELLIRPVTAALTPSATVVLVPDGPLQQLPFSTLRDPRTRRFLIEDYALMATPSASFFVDARAAAAGRAGTPYSSALLVGNPGAAEAAALPGAEAEAAAVAEGYARHELLTGRAATKLRFLQLAPVFEVVHFGGHSLVNPEFPLLSRLVFADEAGVEQSLFAHEIARVRFLRTRLVVLAACSTASGVVSRGEGVVSVARPFLGAGVPLVIASQWDVDDRATGQLSLAFHRALAGSRDPVKALRAAQLLMLRSGDPAQASPDSWGAFVAVGTTAS